MNIILIVIQDIINAKIWSQNFKIFSLEVMLQAITAELISIKGTQADSDLKNRIEQYRFIRKKNQKN